jgi:hypothetical protein
MNWNLIGWFAGVVLTFAGIKFVWVFLREILSRDTMENVIEAAGDGFSNAGKKLGRYLKKKGDERRTKKEEQKPIITIR